MDEAKERAKRAAEEAERREVEARLEEQRQERLRLEAEHRAKEEARIAEERAKLEQEQQEAAERERKLAEERAEDAIVRTFAVTYVKVISFSGLAAPSAVSAALFVNALSLAYSTALLVV